MYPSWLEEYENKVVDKYHIQAINQLYEVCESDKRFFVLWNRYINDVNARRYGKIFEIVEPYQAENCMVAVSDSAKIVQKNYED